MYPILRLDQTGICWKFSLFIRMQNYNQCKNVSNKLKQKGKVRSEQEKVLSKTFTSSCNFAPYCGMWNLSEKEHSVMNGKKIKPDH
jgi:hypothetical protein